jgi:hypothetical protein
MIDPGQVVERYALTELDKWKATSLTVRYGEE